MNCALARMALSTSSTFFLYPRLSRSCWSVLGSLKTSLRLLLLADIWYPASALSESWVLNMTTHRMAGVVLECSDDLMEVLALWYQHFRHYMSYILHQNTDLPLDRSRLAAWSWSARTSVSGLWWLRSDPKFVSVLQRLLFSPLLLPLATKWWVY